MSVLVTFALFAFAVPAHSAETAATPAFVVAAGKATFHLPGPGGETDTRAEFTPKGRARVDRFGSLLAAGGAFVAEGVAGSLGPAWSGADAATWILTLAADRETAAPEDILAVPKIAERVGFTIFQHGKDLFIRSEKNCTLLGAIAPGSPAHLTIVQQSSGDTLYFNGQKVANASVSEDVSTAAPATEFLVGSGTFAVPGWRGRIDALAAYAAPLTADAVQALAAAAQESAAAQKRGPALVVRAKRIARSETISVEDLAPYTQSLTVYAYAVEEVLQGEPPKAPLYVAHWAILDSTRLPFDEQTGDATVLLRLDRYEDHPELQSENISDGVIDDFSIPLYYDAGGASLGLERQEK